MSYLYLVDPLSSVLRRVRIGDFVAAAKVLSELEIPPEPPPLGQYSPREQLALLRLAALQAEIADHAGDYEIADAFIGWYPLIEDELQQLSCNANRKVSFDSRNDLGWKLLRQKLYYLWQVSVARYRSAQFDDSNAAMAIALKLAEELQPRAEGLRTQLFYGAGKLALHDSNYLEATIHYRKSLVNAEALLDAQRRYVARRRASDLTPDAAAEERVVHETAASHYAMGKALALGLGQCLREQGRLEEAQMAVVAGRMLLDGGCDITLAHHARLLLGSIERGAAGNHDAALLSSARGHLQACERFFKEHHGDVSFRAEYELALVAMQQNDLEQAKVGAERVLHQAKTRKRDRWTANAQIALSRIARRAGSYTEASEWAADALAKAELRQFEKIERRARVALALALYAAAVADGYNRDKLAEVQKLVDRSLATLKRRDLRNRVELLLLKTRVLHARGESSEAINAYDEYKSIGHLVESGRVRELAATVEKELFPSISNFRCPADKTPPDYRLKDNVEAARLHVIRKVLALKNLSVEEKAQQLGVVRQSLPRLRKEVEAAGLSVDDD